MNVKINDILPDEEVFTLVDGDPKKQKISEIIGNKKVVLFGLPGAYTSVCSAKHLPGYINNLSKFKAKGIDQVLCISVNDPFVMNAWGKANNVGDNILMLADPFLNFTRAIGAEVDKSSRGLGHRSNRYTMLIDNLKILNIQAEPDTGTCEVSAAENFLELI